MFADRIQAGTTVLDAVDPHWFYKVSVRKLDLRSGSLCVLGQLFDGQAAQTGYGNGFNYAIHEVPHLYGSTIEAAKARLSWARAHGFDATDADVAAFVDDDRDDPDVDPEDLAYQSLVDAWAEVINARRAAA